MKPIQGKLRGVQDYTITPNRRAKWRARRPQGGMRCRPGGRQDRGRGRGSRGHRWSSHHGSRRKVSGTPPKSRGEFIFIVNQYAKGLDHLRHVREEKGSKLLN